MVLQDVAPGFKFWLKTNINQFQGNFSYQSAEGERGTDGDIGSSFWFSSQKRRISNKEGQVIVPTIFKLEDGEKPIEDFLTQLTGINIKMPHSNKSEYDDFMSFYDDELLELALQFEPIQEDMDAFGYQIPVANKTDNLEDDKLSAS